MSSASKNPEAPHRLGEIVCSTMIATVIRRLYVQDATGLHYALRIFVGATLSWFLLRWFGVADPLWAIISLVVVTEPNIDAAWLAFKSRTLNTAIGCTTGLIFLLVAGPESWVLPTALAVTVLICTYLAEVPMSWRIAPVTAALVIAPGVLEHSRSGGVDVALRRVGEVILGSAMALLVSWIMAKIWLPRRVK